MKTNIITYKMIENAYDSGILRVEYSEEKDHLNIKLGDMDNMTLWVKGFGYRAAMPRKEIIDAISVMFDKLFHESLYGNDRYNKCLNYLQMYEEGQIKQKDSNNEIVKRLILALNDHVKSFDCMDIDNDTFIDFICKKTGLSRERYMELMDLEEREIEKKNNVKFSSPEEMLEFIQDGNDLYNQDTGEYVFVSSDDGNLGRSQLDKDTMERVKNLSEENHTYWSDYISGGEVLEVNPERADLESALDYCKRKYSSEHWMLTNKKDKESAKTIDQQKEMETPIQKKRRGR